MNVERSKSKQVEGGLELIDEAPERRASWFELIEMDVEGKDGSGLVS